MPGGTKGFNPVKGEPPKVSWEPCEALNIDEEYQRSIECPRSTKLILEIAENWDWRLCAPLTVSHRADSSGEMAYFVIDGQHRLRAAELRGDIPELPCIISKFDTFEDEAMAFVSINSARQQVTALDKFHARVAAKEPLALKIKALVEGNSLTVTRHNAAEYWNPGEIAFPDLVGKKLEEDSEEAGFALFILAMAYEGKPLLRGADLFSAIYMIVRGGWDNLPWEGEEGWQGEPFQELAIHIGSRLQAAWIKARDRYNREHECGNDHALAAVILQDFCYKITLSAKPKGHGQRRFETKKPGNGVVLVSDHPAVEEGRTLFPSTRKETPEADDETKRVLKIGHNSSKIGKEVELGDWKGFPIFTLTLEERATCPDTCKMLESCYGNNMHLAQRFQPGKDLENKLWEEMRVLQDLHPDGFVVRLHVLGDFYSLDYVKFWQQAMGAFSALNIYGYTAHDPDGEIGGELLGMTVEHWHRFAMRFSNAGMSELSTVTIEQGDAVPEGAFACPAQSGTTACCATCALCWSTEKNVAFVRH